MATFSILIAGGNEGDPGYLINGGKLDQKGAGNGDGPIYVYPRGMYLL